MDFDTFWRHVRNRRASPERSLVAFPSISSSHGLARRAVNEYQAESAAPPPIDVLAWQQTEGQGRQGRSWSSPAGAGVYASMVRVLDPKRIPHLPMLVPMALATVLRRQSVDCELKWPNDLMVGGLKIGGVLIDAIDGEASPVAVISFGINHAAQCSEHFSEPDATSLGDLGASVALDELCVELLEEVDRRLSSGVDSASVVAEYRELSAHRPGDELECHLDGAEQKTRGVFLGIDDNGFLRMQVDGEEKVLSSGRLVG